MEARQTIDKLSSQRENVLDEYRQFKEQSSRDAAAARLAFEVKLAALTDKAFKLADPEVHACVLMSVGKCTVPPTPRARLACVGGPLQPDCQAG